MTCLSQASPPSLTRLTPPGGQRGQTISVRCEGKFDWPASVFAPGVDVEVTEETGVINVKIPQELSSDRIWLRLFNQQGASSPAPFLIGNVEEVAEEEPNNSLQQAQVVSQLPAIINGVLKSADVDCFSVHLDEGQTLIAAIDAHSRLGSPIDSILQIVSEKGFILSENNDEIGLDPVTTYTATKSGLVVVRLFGFSSEPNQSISLQGSNDCHYRLTLTSDAFATHIAPLAISNDKEAQVQFIGWGISDRLTATGRLLGFPNLVDELEIETPGDLKLINDSRLGYADHPLLPSGRKFRYVNIPTMALLNRDLGDSSITLDIPVAVTGRLNRDGQADSYSVQLTTGDTLLIACEAQTLGLPTDPWVRLLDPAGKIVADVDDSSRTRDSHISYSVKTDGVHTIVVTDRFKKSGPRHLYLLTATLEQPDFQLRFSKDQLVMTEHDSVDLSVQVLRRRGTGNIRIMLDGLPERITATAVESLAEGESAENVQLKLISAGGAFSGPIRIIGETTEPFNIRRLASTSTSLDTSLSSLWLTVLPATENPKPLDD